MNLGLNTGVFPFIIIHVSFHYRRIWGPLSATVYSNLWRVVALQQKVFSGAGRPEVPGGWEGEVLCHPCVRERGFGCYHNQRKPTAINTPLGWDSNTLLCPRSDEFVDAPAANVRGASSHKTHLEHHRRRPTESVNLCKSVKTPRCSDSHISQSVRQPVSAWPICVAESDQQRRCPGLSPDAQQGSRVSAPTASVLRHSWKDRARRFPSKCPVMCVSSLAAPSGEFWLRKDLMCHLFYCVKRWNSCGIAAEMDMNGLSLRFREREADEAALQIY